jgi:hypothetical protein
VCRAQGKECVQGQVHVMGGGGTRAMLAAIYELKCSAYLYLYVYLTKDI